MEPVSFIHEAFEQQTEKKIAGSCPCPCGCYGQTNFGSDSSGHYSCFSSNNSLIEITGLGNEYNQ